MKFAFEDCIVDTDTHELRRDGAPVAVEPKAFHLLHFLIENGDRVVSKDELLEQIWNGRIVSDAALSSAVKAARAAIGDSGAKQALIKTVHGTGFRFVGHAVTMGAQATEPATKLVQDIHYCRSADGTSIAYALSGDGPLLVKSANWLSHLQYELESPIWRPWIEALSARFRLLRYDERGSGLSDRKPEDLSFDTRVNDLESVVDDAGLQEPFILFGISAGCAYSVAYAVRNPERVRALILYGGFPQSWRVRGKISEKMLALAIKNLIEGGWGKNNPVFRQMFTTLFMPKATDEQIEWFTELQRKTADPETAMRLWDAAGDIDVADILAAVNVPTLVLHAQDDALVPDRLGRDLATGIPGARYATVESRNHVLLSQDPGFAQLLAEVDRFVASLQ